ncbi:MAG TPA: virulence RhuM family protein [Holophagaceae bacterium]|nr:virulence RhuM family protein [Holophagaceae bacterium]
MSDPTSKVPPPSGGMLLYQTEDGRTRIQCRFEAETLWLTQAQMAELFQTTPQNVTLHLKAIFAEGELAEGATCKDYLQVREEGGRTVTRKLRHYRLEAILAVGYRVRSHRGTQFRQWATARLSEYLVKGFAMDDERLKNPPGAGQKDYFDELLERIRDIRSSERRFYQKVLDIYATSVDYAPDAEASHLFFATIQNKMHWAAHGHTAAEVIHERADAGLPNMGLQTTRPGGHVRKDDVAVAKNYLTEPELQVLNRIVNLYLEFAELQALERRPMTMRDWIAKLDEFLKISGREVLDHPGHISAEAARHKAELEYERYRAWVDAQPRAVDADFEKAVKALKRPPALSRKKKES